MRIIGDGGHANAVRSVLVAGNFHFASDFMFIAVGDNASRKKEAEDYIYASFPVLIHPFSWWSPYAHIDSGTVIMAGAVVQPGATIGKHCIINTCASVDHDCTLGDYVHIAPGARLCGNVTVGEGALIGAGAICVPGAVIAPWSLIKAGSVCK